MSHLRDRVSALVDGELDPDARDRAIAHLMSCARCRAEVEEERLMKGRLGGLPASEPSADLLSALFSFPRHPAVSSPVLCPAAADHGLRAGFVLAGAGSISAAMFAVAYLLGGAEPAPPTAPPVTPPVGQFSATFAGTTEGLPFSDPAVGVYPVSVSATGSPVGAR